jgi:two-component system chemotaxis response regulator CheY
MSKRFLVVDDSASIRQLVTYALNDAGFEVLAATNGEQAIGLLAGNRVDMVITDLNMPEMDGIELIRKVRGMAESKFIPIIMLTTEAQDDKKREGKEAGASGWIVKPFSPEQLLGVVRKFLR